MTRQFCWCSLLLFCVMPLVAQADTLRGTVTDERGKPISGARVDVATAAPKVGAGIFCPSCYLDCGKWTRSNEQGEFVIDGLDSTLKFRILSTAPYKQTKLTELIDPATATAQLVLPDFPADTPPDQILAGTVVSAEGVPIPGALIEPYGAKTAQKRWWGPVEAQATVSDDDGHFRMWINVPGYQGIDVVVAADGYAGTKSLLLSPGADLHEIQVPTGTTVTGQLVDQGQPKPGQRIAVVQVDRGVENHFIKSVLAVTDHEGRFEFKNLPAKQQYAIFSPVGERNSRAQSPAKILTTKKFNAVDNNSARDLGALEMSDSLSLAGRLLMVDETPLPAGLKMNLGRDPAWDLIEVPIDSEGQFQISGLPPETYEVRLNFKDAHFDSTRLNFQVTGRNSFGLRLTQTRNELEIPLLRDAAQVPQAESNRKSIPANNVNAVAPSEPVEIQPSRSEQNSRRPVAQLTDEPVPVDGPKLSVRGTVITAKGERIAGATVVVRAKIGGQQFHYGAPHHETLHNHDVLARTTSDDNGRFLCSDVPIPLRMMTTITSLMKDQAGAQALAYADGYGLAVVDIQSIDSKVPLRIVLKPAAEVHGVIRNEQGTGIANAKIELLGLTGTRGEISHVLNGPTDTNLMKSQFDRTTVADQAGNFTIQHAPEARRLIVEMTAEGYQRQVIAIDTTVPRDGVPARSDTQTFEGRMLVLQSPVEIALKSRDVFKVRVVDHDGNLVNDGVVQYMQLDGTKVISIESKAISAETGFVTFGRDHSHTARLCYNADPFHPRISCSMPVTDTKAIGDDPLELRLPESRWIAGQVVNSASGEPVAGAMVRAVFADANFESRFLLSTAISRQNGEFRLPVAMRKGRVSVSSALFGFYDAAANDRAAGPHGVDFDVTDQDLTSALVLKLTPGLIVEGTVFSEVGAPAAGVIVTADQTQRRYLGLATRTNVDGQYRISGLAADQPMVLTVVIGPTAARKTIEGIAIKQLDDVRRETVDLTAAAGVQLTGRVMRNGKPQPGIKMELSRSLPQSPNRRQLFTTVLTDETGSYLVGGLDPGDYYGFEIITPDHATAPDWTYQTPYFNLIAADATGIVKLPDANLISSTQSLNGVVVDVDGNPVSGINISVRLKSGRSLARRENVSPPWAETSRDGKFELRQLPDEDLQLMAYKANPGGGVIRYPVYLNPERNQTDIRIILDPSLLIDVEDLDRQDQGAARSSYRKPRK